MLENKKTSISCISLLELNKIQFSLHHALFNFLFLGHPISHLRIKYCACFIQIPSAFLLVYVIRIDERRMREEILNTGTLHFHI